MRDVVGRLFGRLGLAGAILIASFFVFGVMAGAVVVHRLQASPSASIDQQGEGTESAPGQGAGEKTDNEAGESESRQATAARTNPPKGAENSQNED